MHGALFIVYNSIEYVEIRNKTPQILRGAIG